jgi:hypothetical protein
MDVLRKTKDKALIAGKAAENQTGYLSIQSV